MNLPFFTNKQASKFYFGLLLKEIEGIGFVMRLENNKLILVDREKFQYSNGFDNISEDVDQLLLKLESSSKLHLKETIFFVYTHFLDPKTNEIKKGYLEKIKHLTKNLELKPLGYIECHEAVSYFVGKRDELPMSALVIELDKSVLSFFVYKRGKKTYAESIPQSDNLIDDLLISFSKIQGKFLLPSRIILYNSKSVDEEATKIFTYKWSEELFIQLPRVEALKENDLIEGMLGIFGEQLTSEKTSVVFETNKKPEQVLGFLIGQDILESEMQVKPESAKVFSLPVLNFEKIISAFKNFTIPLKSISKTWSLLLGTLLIVLSLLLHEYFLHKATLTLFVPTKDIKKDISIDLPIKFSTRSADLNASKAVTGRREVGEKSKGTATIHNFDDKEKVFAKGTVIENSGLKFALDQDIKVASSSVVTVSGNIVKQPGKAKVNVTASYIGPQGNLESGRQFKIADLASTLYFALNETSFSGGSKKEIKTVAKKDMEDLRVDIKNMAKKQKLTSLDKKELNGFKVLDDLTQITLVSEKFDKEVAEETDTLNLQAEVAATLYLYKDSQILDFIADKLKNSVDKEYKLEKDRISYKLDEVKKKNDVIELKIKASANTIKDLTEEDVIKKVRTQSKSNAEKILKKNFDLKGYTLVVESKLPFVDNILPIFTKNIHLKITSF